MEGDDSSDDPEGDANAMDVITTGAGEMQLMTEIRRPRESLMPSEETRFPRMFRNAARGFTENSRPNHRPSYRLPKDPEQAVLALQHQLQMQTYDIAELQQTIDRIRESRESIKKKAMGLHVEHQNLAASFERAQETLQHTKEERDSLQNQVVELKQGLSKIGRAEGQLSDDFLNDEAKQLAHSIQNWVVKNTKKLQLTRSIDKLSTNTKLALSKANSPSSRATSFSKLHIFQAIIARKIMSIFDANTLFFTAAEDSATALCERIQATNADQGRYYHWRAMTYTLLYNLSDEQLERVTENPVVKMAESVEEIFCELLNAPHSTDRVKSLRRVLLGVIKLSRGLRTQRACIQFKMPTLQKFNPAMMQNEHGDEATEMAGEKIAYVLFPMLVKHGNDHGENMESETIISKARVVCLKETEANSEDELEEAN